MHVTRTKAMLWLTAAVCTAGAAAAVWAAAVLPLAVPPTGPAQPAGARGIASPAAQSVPPLETFEPAWRAPLRRPLVDPPPQLATATQPAAPALPLVRLVGTIIDGDRPRGVFMIGLATVELKGVGEKAGGAEVLRIDADSATLSYNGQPVVLKREKNPFDPTGGTAELLVRPPATATGEGS